MRGAWLLCLLAACAAPSGTSPAGPRFAVEVEGNQEVSSLVLRAAARRELQAFRDHQRRAADAADAADAMLLELYQRGYAHARVDFVLEEQRLLFRVDEGLRAYLAAVGFDGVSSFAEKDLAAFFAFAGSDLLGTGRPLFRYEEIESAAAKVERFYLLNGFLHVRVAEPRVAWSESDTLADVTIAIEEGRRYAVTRVDFEGIEPVELGLRDASYHARLPVEAAAKLRGELLKQGFQFSAVSATADIDEDTASVRLLFRVERGEKVRLRRVRFEGQDRTKEWFLRRRVPLEESEIIAQELYDEGIANLYRTGLFSSVRARLNRVDETTADVEIALKELQARSVDFELGYGTYELVRGAVRYRDQNFLGTGRRLGAEVQGSVRSLAVNFDLEDPYLFGERTPVMIAGGLGYRQEPSFDRITIAAEVGVTRVVRGLRLSGGYRFRSEEARNAKVTVDPEEEGFIRTAGIFFGLRKDTRDAIFAPTTGWVGEIGLNWNSSALGGDLNFLGWDLRFTRYVPLPGRIVLVLGGRFRTHGILDGSDDLPIQERLFIGGPSDVRSFGQSELGPTENGEPRGGLTALNATVEFRRPVWRAIHGAIFYDYGTVSAQGWSLNSPPGHGVGVGVRYMLPIGPLRFDVAYNPGRLFAANSRWQFNLAFGFTF